MLRQCIVRYFVEIHELETELNVFEARGVANFGARSMSEDHDVPYILAYKSLSRLSRPLKIESVCGPKSLTRV